MSRDTKETLATLRKGLESRLDERILSLVRRIEKSETAIAELKRQSSNLGAIVVDPTNPTVQNDRPISPSASKSWKAAIQKWWRDELWTFKFWKEALQLLGVFFAIVFGAFTAAQWWDARRHFQLDERAWIEIRPSKDDKRDADHPWTNLEVLNVGKSPARKLRVHHGVRFLASRQQPILDFGRADSTTVLNLLFPASTPFYLNASDSILTPEQRESFIAGESYTLVFALAEYEDIFGNFHWVRYCGIKPLKDGTYSSFRCTQYNDTDGK